MNGKKQVFEASQLAGQPGKPLHTIPYTFQSSGDYSISIPVYGILFNPIKPESAEYSFKVTPEFPIASLMLTAMMAVVLVVVTKFKKGIPSIFI